MPSTHIISAEDHFAALKRINQQNEQFWGEQATLLQARGNDEALVQIALHDLKWQESRGIPFGYIPTLESALAKAEESQNIVRSVFSQKGGKTARRRTALRKLIDELILDNPQISVRELFLKLRGEAGIGVVTSIDREEDRKADEPLLIHFVDDDGTAKTASIAGLKDRLAKSKAKVKIKSL